jgi:hypothetical protein
LEFAIIAETQRGSGSGSIPSTRGGRRLKGLSTIPAVTAVFLVFHFTLHWIWRQTLLVPMILAIFFPALSVYEFVTRTRPTPKP